MLSYLYKLFFINVGIKVYYLEIILYFLISFCMTKSNGMASSRECLAPAERLDREIDTLLHAEPGCRPDASVPGALGPVIGGVERIDRARRDMTASVAVHRYRRDQRIPVGVIRPFTGLSSLATLRRAVRGGGRLRPAGPVPRGRPAASLPLRARPFSGCARTGP